MSAGQRYVAFEIDSYTRYLLTQMFPARHSIVVMHHVTLIPPPYVEQDSWKLAAFASTPVIHAYGIAESLGIDALAVQVNDSRMRPDDNAFYHLTMSHAEHMRPVQSRYLEAQIEPLSSLLRLTGAVKVLERKST